MSEKGKKFNFHGSFAVKADAIAQEKKVNGFIVERTVRGKIRYFVLTEK